jgi:uncharacterized protein (DUF4415 family)
MSKHPPLTNKDGEVREIAAADMPMFKPVAEADPAIVEAMQRMKNKGGRPKLDAPKKMFGLRIDPKVADGIKSTGKGYNARVEDVLREALASGKLDAPPPDASRR